MEPPPVSTPAGFLLWLDRSRASSAWRDEHVFDRTAEKLGDPECQRERRIVFAGFDRIHALAGDFEPLRKIGLAPATLGAKDSQSVFHFDFRKDKQALHSPSWFVKVAGHYIHDKAVQ